MIKRIVSWLVLYYFRFWARIAIRLNQPKIIGITGSVGKSSTRNAVFSILKDYYLTKVIKKGNSETGIPLGILGLQVGDYSFLDWLRLIIFSPFGIFYLKSIQYLIIEMGVDDPYPPKNMGYLLTIVKPDIGIFLNVYPIHTMQFEKIAEKDRDFLLKKITKEKGRIISEANCEIGIYNQDNDYVVKEVKSKRFQSKVGQPLDKKLLSFGKAKNNNIYYLGYKISLLGTKFRFFIKNKGEISLTFKNYLLPKVYEEVFGSAILIGLSVGLKISQIKKSLEDNFSLPYGRSSVFKGINNSIIIDSSYNASRASVLSFLEMAYEIKKQTNKQLIFVFGEMRELGRYAEKEHHLVVEEIIYKVDYLYCVGSLTKKYVVEYIGIHYPKSQLKELKWFKNSVLLGEYLKENVPSQSIVLFKGSQNTIFLEEGLKYILKNKNDFKNLCRQNQYWIELKNKFFSQGSGTN